MILLTFTMPWKYYERKLKRTRVLISEVIVLAKLILVSPATNAESEMMFSALRRLKTYLRSTMSDERLNYLMVLHVQKGKTDSIDHIKTAN